jgi:hypothetical protein
LSFGDDAGTGASYFLETDATVQFEDRNLTAGRFGVQVDGNATGSSTFQLGLPVAGTKGGTNGVSWTAPEGTGPFFVANDQQADEVFIYGSTLGGFTAGIQFAFGTLSPDHEVFNNLFSGNGEIVIALVQFKNNSIVNAIPQTADVAAARLPASMDDIEDLRFQMGVEGHAVRRSGTGTLEFRNINFTGYSANMTGALFNTETQVSAAADTITTTFAHNQVTGEPIILNDDGGTETIGLTEGTTYYGRAITGFVLSFHTSAADAASDTARVPLTPSTAGKGETQILYSGNAAFLNDSVGLVTLTIVGGTVPSVRNKGAATTTVNNFVETTLTGLKDNTEVRVYAAGTTTPELAGIENATVGTTDDRSFAFQLTNGTSVDIRIFAVAYEPADLLSFSVREASIPIQQRFDRTYENPS